MITTPAMISPEILILCKKINPSILPEYVPVRPKPGAIVNECFPNVQTVIQQEGGSIQHGWQIWERPKVFIEAEFHAVWVAPSGEYIDVTPKKDGETQILFLPDPNRTFNEERVDNIRMPLQDNQLIKNFLSISEKISQVQKKYADGNFGLVSIPQAEIMPLYARLEELDRRIRQTIETPGRNDPCPCNSGKKYKKCCGRQP